MEIIIIPAILATSIVGIVLGIILLVVLKKGED